MTNYTNDRSQRKAARFAGFMFLFTFTGPLFYGAFLFPKLTVPENVITTANNVIANELLFRIGIINELICAVGAVVFAVTLYIILKSINKNLALFAFSLKMVEAGLLAVIALGHFIALLVLNGRTSLTVFEPDQVQALVGLLINLYFHLGAFTMVFHGLNSMIFLYLLFKSRYVPHHLAGFGTISYAFVFIYGLIAILEPDYATLLTIQIICLAPSVLAELILGSWLLIKGINIQPRNPALESA
jgi:hypothetical protein